MRMSIQVWLDPAAIWQSFGIGNVGLNDFRSAAHSLDKMDLSRLSLIRQVEIETPCPENWDAMTGDEARRFCAGCGCHVHNLAKLPAAEAEQLLAAPERVCARITVDAKKGILTRDGWIPRLLAAGAMAAAAAGASGCTQELTGDLIVPTASHSVKKPTAPKTVSQMPIQKKSTQKKPIEKNAIQKKASQPTMGYVSVAKPKPTKNPTPAPPVLGRPRAITGKIAAPPTPKSEKPSPE